MWTDEPKYPAPNVDSPYPCGYRWARPGRFWPLIPLSIFGAIVTVFVVAWVLEARLPWSGTAPVFWPIFPIGFFLGILCLFIVLRWAFWGGWWDGWRGGNWSPYSRRQVLTTPDEILRLRYARGEISSDEYRRLKDDLRIPQEC